MTMLLSLEEDAGQKLSELHEAEIETRRRLQTLKEEEMDLKISITETRSQLCSLQVNVEEVRREHLKYSNAMARIKQTCTSLQEKSQVDCIALSSWPKAFYRTA